MNGHIDDHMNKGELTGWLRNRKWGKQILIGELIYVAILLLALVFYFPLFMHLIVFQGIVVLAYLVIGWVFDKKGATVKFKQHDSLWDTVTSIRFNKLFFIRMFEMIDFWVVLGAAIVFARQLWNDIWQKPLDSSLVENVTLYGDFLVIILLLAIDVIIIGANKKAMRISGIIALVSLVAIIFVQNSMLIPALVGIVGSVGVIALSLQTKL